MTGGDAVFGQHRLHGVGQGQKPQRVGDMAAALADGPRHVLLVVAEFLDQALIGLGLLQGLQVLALDILDQRQLELPALIEVLANDDRNGFQSEFG